VCVRIWRVFQLRAVVFQFRGFVFITVVPLFPRSAPSSLWNESDLHNDLRQPARHQNITTQLDLFGESHFESQTCECAASEASKLRLPKKGSWKNLYQVEDLRNPPHGGFLAMFPNQRTVSGHCSSLGNVVCSMGVLFLGVLAHEQVNRKPPGEVSFDQFLV